MEGGQGLEVEEEEVVVAEEEEAEEAEEAVEREDLLVASFVKELSEGLGCCHGLSHTYRQD